MEPKRMTDLRKLAALRREDVDAFLRAVTMVSAEELDALADVVEAARMLGRDHKLYGLWRLPDRFRDIAAALDRLQETTR